MADQIKSGSATFEQAPGENYSFPDATRLKASSVVFEQNAADTYFPDQIILRAGGVVFEQENRLVIIQVNTMR
jgi:hypothetical protein